MPALCESVGEIVLAQDDLQAVFDAERGLNLLSLRKGSKEYIAQSTKEQFERRRGGLGPLIGPHFHRRKVETIRPVIHEANYPHIAILKAEGSSDPFTHGIARYAPWKVKADQSRLVGRLTGKDVWNGSTLAELEGMNFEMGCEAALIRGGLELKLSVRADSDAVIGIHYYLHLPGGRGTVRSAIADQYRTNQGVLENVPQGWLKDGSQSLEFDLAQEADFAFLPSPVSDGCGSSIELDTQGQGLRVEYASDSAENCWQLFHPAHSNFVCIEPLTAANPRKPQLTVSKMTIRLFLY